MAARTCTNRELGKRGENAAARFLERHGYEILERNWTCDAGEADIIARDDDSLRFVEVKTRSDCSKGFPAEAVNAAKRDRYERIAAFYLMRYDGDPDITIGFDIISIIRTGETRGFLRMHRNAFARG